MTVNGESFELDLSARQGMQIADQFARAEAAKYAITFDNDVPKIDFSASVYAANVTGNDAAAPGAIGCSTLPSVHS